MPNYFIIDANGTKHGPINEQQLKALAAQGRITPTTSLETDTGHKGRAGQIRGLFSDPSPTPSPTTSLTTPPANQAAPQRASASTATRNKGLLLITVGGILILLIGIAIGWSMMSGRNNTPLSSPQAGNVPLAEGDIVAQQNGGAVARPEPVTPSFQSSCADIFEAEAGGAVSDVQ